ncbi:ABC transporter ATP-binding protein [Stratiformator vulcanicus]|uniref:Teichoic acids export ATP-binding protein TagH n=1 Tax=Stratiformator vulcanicus TaxID=2527980 RepID=A0A517QZD9_9PLAN|nr:polysaccharide ABC transporter ATP-binding protein [Stratiformator vulcanicus]QDT37009.1 Teichoic acids export ATP-binding protein TagH [Stratiformator vulcanicus]
MSNYSIKVEDLSKRYRIADTKQQRRTYRSLREDLVSAAGSILKRKSPKHDFWALKDVSFEVQPGEVVGVIGRNGAGKSTLLKILSRITDPTSGRVHLRGRVGSLLEVGTGFHPELTGRENIYLSGTVLGMTRAEIKRKFEEIVEFAGVEEFLETPVKRYSSGMSVRLGFAVAAHLEPEILIIDEVLAVGDAEFQKRCLGKMGEVAKSGRTVLFVSHNMAAVRRMCNAVAVINSGKMTHFGETQEAISKYLQSDRTAEDQASIDLIDYPHRYGNGNARFARAEYLSSHPHNCRFRTHDSIEILLCIDGSSSQSGHFSATCSSEDGTKVLHLSSFDDPDYQETVINEKTFVKITISALPLLPGHYSWSFGLHDISMMPTDVVMDILPFAILNDSTSRPFATSNRYGYCLTDSTWTVSQGETTVETD